MELESLFLFFLGSYSPCLAISLNWHVMLKEVWIYFDWAFASASGCNCEKSFWLLHIWYNSIGEDESVSSTTVVLTSHPGLWWHMFPMYLSITDSLVLDFTLCLRCVSSYHNVQCTDWLLQGTDTLETIYMFQCVSIHIYIGVWYIAVCMWRWGVSGCVQTHEQNGCDFWVTSGQGLE